MAGYYKSGSRRPGNKKRWTRPVLTVLVRANDGERVLTFCKAVTPSTGAQNFDISCSVLPTMC